MMSTREDKKRINQEEEEEEEGFLLIPGLPGDLALQCLVRVPVTSHDAMIRVSKPWRNLLLDRDSEFYTLRSQLGLLQPMVFLVPTTRGDANQYIPMLRVRAPSFFKIEATLCPHKSRIFVIGGLEDEATKRTNDFYIVDTLTRKIKKGPEMLFSTSGFAYGVLKGNLYVAGGLEDGHDTTEQWSTSAQCYDISSNTWRQISPLPFPIMPKLFLVDFGLFIVTGFSPDGSDKHYHYMCYSDETDSWAVYNSSQYEKKVLELVETRAHAVVKEHYGALTASTSIFGMLYLRTISDMDDAEEFNLKNMGDVGRLLQNQDVKRFYTEHESFIPRDALPTITDTDGVGGALRLSAKMTVIHVTWTKTPVHSKWSNLPLLFYPVCGELGIGTSEVMGIESPEYIEFDFVVVCY